MKLTKEQKKLIKDCWGDWETVHCFYDDFMKERLKQLDKEFIDDLDKETKNADFWYA